MSTSKFKGQSRLAMSKFKGDKPEWQWPLFKISIGDKNKTIEYLFI